MRVLKKSTAVLLLALLLVSGALPARAFYSGDGLTEGKVIMSWSTGFALDEDGILWTWGLGSAVQTEETLYFPDLELRNPAPVKAAEGVKSVALGDGVYFSYIDEDDCLWTNMPFGETGAPTEPRKVLEDVAAAATGSQYVAAVKNDGTLWIRGTLWNPITHKGEEKDMNVFDEFTEVMDGVRAISGAYAGMAIVTDDGDLLLWGDLLDIIDIRTYLSYAEPTKVMDGVASACMGNSNVAAVKENGTLWIWGNNRNGCVGSTEKFAPVVEMPAKIRSGVRQAVVGGSLAAAVTEDGKLLVWGRLKDNEAPMEETEIDTDVVFVTVGNRTLAYVKEDGTLWTWGTGANIGNGDESEPNGLQTADEPVQILENVTLPSGDKAPEKDDGDEEPGGESEAEDPAEEKEKEKEPENAGFPWTYVVLGVGAAATLTAAAALILLLRKPKQKKQ